MPRPPGRRNDDFDDKRVALAGRVRVALLALGPGASLRDLATRAEVSVTQLRHYFGDRDGVFAAVADEMHRSGQRFMDAAAVPRTREPAAALREFLASITLGWRAFGLERVFAVGLAEGLASRARGRAYVTHVLEPTLQCAERLLAAMVARGDFAPFDLRAGALALVAPVLLALLHQDALDGAACRPLALDALLEVHVTGWIHGHGGVGAGSAR